MPERRSTTFADLIVDLVAEEPRTGFEICRALEEEQGLSLRGREATIYPALVQLVRGGHLVSEVEETDAGPRRFYRLPVLVDVGDDR